MKLAEYLPEDYLPPYGTSITPDDFVVRDLSQADEIAENLDDWLEPFLADLPMYSIEGGTLFEVEALGDDGKKHKYGIALILLECFSSDPENDVDNQIEIALPLLNHEYVSVVDPFSYLRLPVGTHLEVAEVYDWILRQDALNRPDNNPWLGDDIDSQLRRIESNITIASVAETNLLNFDTVAEFQQWLDSNLNGITQKVEAFKVKRFLKAKWDYDPKLHSDCDCGGIRCYRPILRESTVNELNQVLPLLNQHYHPENTAIKINVPDYVHLDANGRETRIANWERINRPELFIHTDGPEIVSYCSGDIVSWNALTKATSVLIPSESDPVKATKNSWWGLHIVGTDLALIFPRRFSNIVVNTYRDAATFSIEIVPTGQRVAENTVNDRFEREWGKWLDDDAVLTPAELQAGNAKAERLMHEANHRAKANTPDEEE